MTLEIKSSPNYAATIIRVPAAFKLPNSDRLYGLSVFGYTAIVDDSWITREGELAVFFPAEAQLSHDFTRASNLYRHTDLNENPTEQGYLEDNRRIRALKLRGNVSNGLVLPLTSIYAVTPVHADNFTEGTSFDTVNGVEISRKYVVKESQVHDRNAQQVARAFRRVDSTMLPEHFETEQYLRNEHYFHDDDIIVVTQKLHGTSARFGNTLMRKQLKWYERLAKRVGIQVSETYYDTVAGSRRAIKDPNNPAQAHYYGAGVEGDVWTEYLKRIEDKIPQGYIIYGEIVGFTASGAEIQKGHTYGQKSGEMELYVYRIASINPDGFLLDLSWDQVRGFCEQRGLRWTPELWRGFKRDFDVEDFKEMNFAAYRNHNPHSYVDEPVPLTGKGTGADEGIAIRLDRNKLNPLIFKYKNDSHYLYETKLLDEGVEDLEAAES